MKTAEHELQRACIKWFRLQYKEYAMNLFAIPNGAKRDARSGKWYKDEGMTAGVSDAILLVPSPEKDKEGNIIGMGTNGVCIEFKTDKGKQTDAQKEFQIAVLNRGYAYWIIRDFDTFRKAIENYMEK